MAHVRVSRVGIVAFSFLCSSAFASVASADLVSPAQEACSNKSPLDACVMPDGRAGACAARTDERSRTRLTCEVATAVPPSPLPVASAPQSDPRSGPAESPRAPASTSRGCAFSPGETSSAAVVIPAAVGIVLALRRRRAGAPR
jgi:MYXO-CTERM domain-containing protein